ncbi:MAG: pantetheine-phosphate adenylyltransferase [Promethearchaeota archaeon]|nr:MAG: pantetheine-phosphate adenylyltransferase [Candidatus Lokiarchaeota archaeon]
MLEKVGMGGTFDHLHEGHKYLIETALKVANKVVLGLTTQKMLKRKKFAEKLEAFETRKKNIEEFLQSIDALERVEIIELSNPYGPPINEPEYDGLVVSQETFLNAVRLNELRESNGFKPLVMIIIPMLIGKDGTRISSTAIREQL